MEVSEIILIVVSLKDIILDIIEVYTNIRDIAIRVQQLYVGCYTWNMYPIFFGIECNYVIAAELVLNENKSKPGEIIHLHLMIY